MTKWAWHQVGMVLPSYWVLGLLSRWLQALAGLEENIGQVVLALINGFSLHCPGAGAALLSPAVPGTGFSQHLSAVSAFIFSDLTVQSPLWPFPAEAAQGGRGHHGNTAIHACSPGLLGDSWGPVAPPGLQGHERSRSVVRAQVVKHLPCSSTQAVSVFPQHFVSCSKKPHCFSTVMWMYSRWKHWKECFDCKLLVFSLPSFQEYESLEQENTSLKREIGKLTDEMKHLSEVLKDHEKICPLLHCTMNFVTIPRPDALASCLPRWVLSSITSNCDVWKCH